ncbi:hypothetical protein AVEN_129890-1 [Araneus ventricosus]|uniref:Uncharacterized protein n=1 Tax=Araneus ventricosus TaxID=182803 RepID=A0A4Y2MSX2_ARAVE|nr:hypothetical protein AVEN_129890-1 [Araneus ventricosus]
METEAVCVQNADCTENVAFAVEMLFRIENEHDFLNRLIFSDEATFHVSNRMNISTTAEFGAQKIPMQYRKWKETVQKSMGGVLFRMIQS